MTKVFIAGSRQITRLPAEVTIRIDTMIDKRFQILVGDANGADKAVQTCLAEKTYPHVLVHCMLEDYLRIFFFPSALRKGGQADSRAAG